MVVEFMAGSMVALDTKSTTNITDTARRKETERVGGGEPEMRRKRQCKKICGEKTQNEMK